MAVLIFDAFEGTLLVLAAACAVIGFVMLRWHGLMGGTLSFATGGFLYVMARASFTIVLAVLLWSSAMRAMEAEQWRLVFLNVMLTAMWAFGILLNAIAFVVDIHENKYGQKGAVTAL